MVFGSMELSKEMDVTSMFALLLSMALHLCPILFNYGDHELTLDSNNPVKDINNNAINCNVNGNNAVSRYVTVAAGANFEFEWYHNSRGDEIIASVSSSHSIRAAGIS